MLTNLRRAVLDNMHANKSDAPKPAIAPRFQAGVIAVGSVHRERWAYLRL